MTSLTDWERLIGLVARPEVIPLVLMVGVITLLAALSLRGSRGRETDDAEG